jgi:adiponectin receptor
MELDPSDKHKGCCATHRLVATADAPAYSRSDYILSGYRSSSLTYRQLLCTVFRWHNETINIWSHIFGFVYTIWLMFDANGVGPYSSTWLVGEQEQYQSHLLDRSVCLLFLVAAAVCMFLSVLYHLTGCHSCIWHEKAFALDLTGIGVLIMCSYVPGIYFGFYCRRVWQCVYIGVVAVLLSVAACLPSSTTASNSTPTPDASSSSVSIDIPATPSRRPLSRFLSLSPRTVVFCLTVVFSIVPLLHHIFTVDPTEGSYGVTPRLEYALAIYAVGYALYAGKLPERLAPGKFDYLLNSHQLWHCFVVYAIWAYDDFLRALVSFTLFSTCPASP